MSLFDAILARKLTGGGGSLPKPIPYEYMPEGYPKVEMGMETGLEEQTITIAPTEGNQYIAMLPAFTLTVGKTYNVVYDGMFYQCVGIDYSTLAPDMPYEGVMLGNVSAILGQVVPGNNDDAPFVAASLPSFPQYCVFAVSADQAGDHTFAIYCEGEAATPIDYKFMPGGYPKVRTNVLYENAALPFSVEDGADYGMTEAFSGPTITIGQSYTVVLDGVKYENLIGFADKNTVNLGASKDTGFTDALPFNILSVPDARIMQVAIRSTAATHSITITHEKITPIAKKFLPEGAGAIKYCVFGQDYDTEEYTSSMTYGEIRQSLLAGTMVLGVYGGFLLYPAQVPNMSNDVSTFSAHAEIMFYHHTPNDSFRFLVRDTGYVGFTNYMGS